MGSFSFLTTDHLDNFKKKLGERIENTIPNTFKEDFEKLQTAIDIKSPYYVVTFTYDKAVFFDMKAVDKCPDNGKEMPKQLIKFFDSCYFQTLEEYINELEKGTN